MGQIMLWKVVREHEGDRKYVEGETREGSESDLGHLVPKVLELIGPKPADSEQEAAKSETASEKNKAEGAAPANKAAKAPRRKARK